MAMQELIRMYEIYDEVATRYEGKATEEERAKYNQAIKLRNAAGREIEARM